MAKLTLETAKKAVGTGSFIEQTIKFRGADGEDFEGDILIKVLNSNEVANITDILSLKNDETVPIRKYHTAMLLQAVYETEDKPFFPDIKSVEELADEIRIAMYKAADKVINFTGKHWISTKLQNSSANSSAVGSVEEPLQKQDKI